MAAYCIVQNAFICFVRGVRLPQALTYNFIACVQGCRLKTKSLDKNITSLHCNLKLLLVSNAHANARRYRRNVKHRRAACRVGIGS